MPFTPIQDGDLAVAPQVQQILDALAGVAGAGQAIQLTALESASDHALAIKNVGTGGLGLHIYSSAGADLFDVRDAYTDVDNGTLRVAHASNRVGINNTNPAVALDVTGSASVSGALTVGSIGPTTISGTLTMTGADEVIEALETPLIDVGIGLNNLTDYTRVGISEIKGGTALLAATGRHANSYGVYAPRAVAYPSFASLTYVTPDIADTSTSVGETSGAHTFALVRTGSGLLPGMAAGSTGAQAASALTITAVSANSVTATGLTTANTTDYVGWHFLVTSGSAIGIARKITAHTAGSAPVFTLDSGTSWGTTPSVSDKATLNYGQTTDYVNVLSTYRDDSSTVSTGGVHTTMGFGAFGRNTPTSTGYISGFFGLTINYSKNASVIGAELDVAGDNLYTQTYWQGGQPNSSAGLLIAGARGSYYTYTVTAVNASPATAIQQLSSTWVPNEHVGRGIYVSSGTQAGAQAVVTSNSGDTLTFTPSIPITGLVGATFQLGSLWNGVAIGIGTTGPDINRLGAGWKHGIFFDDYSFAREGAFGIDFKPLSGVDFPIRIPNSTAIYSWKSGQTWAANYPSGTTYVATHPHIPLIGTVADVTYLGTDTYLAVTSNTTGAFGTEIARLGTSGLHLLKGSGGAPAANYLAVYPKSDDNLYKQTSAADEVRILDADIFTSAGSLVHGTGAETFSELALGTKGHAILADTSAPKYEPISRRNRVINGCMRVKQRATLGSTDDSWTLDRWTLLLEAANAATITQETSDVPSNGSKYAMKMTVGSANNNKFGVATYLEYIDIGDLRGKTISLQAKIKATSGISDVRMAVMEWTGTDDTVTSDVVSTSGNQWNVAGSNPDLATSWTLLGTPANLSVTTSWATYKVEGLTVGASANNLAVFIWCNDKTTTTTTDTLLVTDVQLEEGAICTQVERRPYGEEYRYCRRYYRTYGMHVVGVFPSATHWAHTLNFTDVPMRTSPTGALLTTTVSVTEPTVAVRTGTSCTLVPFASSSYGYSARITAADFAGTATAFAFGTTQDMVELSSEL